MRGGGNRRSTSKSAAAAVVEKKTKRSGRHPPVSPSDVVTAALSVSASATSLSFRFLSDNELLLHPSLSVPLYSSICSTATSLSHILSFLHPQTLNIETNLSAPDSCWFDQLISSSYSSSSDRLWFDGFRMSKPSFDLLLKTLSPSLSSDDLPRDRKLGAALFRLAHASPFVEVARRLGARSPAQACKAFYETCRAITDRLGHLFELPSDPKRVLEGFNWMSLPNCCGVIGYSRFGAETNSRGGSVIAQAVVDSEGRFLDVSAGWHGSMSPVEILQKTNLFKAQGPIFLAASSHFQLGRSSIPRYLLGASCCQLLPWLLTPFTEEEDEELGSSRIKNFNEVHARGMELAEHAFWRLRTRWRLLVTGWKECTQALPYVIVASCLLHNYLIKCGEPFPEDEVEVEIRADLGFVDFLGEGTEEGKRVRAMLASQLNMPIRIN